MDIKKLRDKFFRECCVKGEDGLQDVNMAPHNTFEWFVKHFYSEKEVLVFLLGCPYTHAENIKKWFNENKKKTKV